MAQQRLTDRTALNETPNDSDLIHIVDVSDTTDNANGTSKKLTVANLLGGITAVGTQPVENEYADITALLADQGNQTETFFQYVIDASADPNIASGDAYYEKLSGSTGTLATDYRLLSDTETQIITDSNGYRVFRIQYIQDDSSPNDTATGGRIGFNYDTGTDKVTSVVFNNIYSDALDIFYAQRASNTYKLKFYNRNTKVYSFATVTGWTVNGNYYIVDVDSGIDISEISVNNRIELFFEIDNTLPASSTGTVLDLSNPMGTYYNMSSANTSLTYTYTGEVLGGKARLLINTASIPVITGATRINGHPFTPNQDCYLEVEYNGVRVEYWVKAIEISPEQDITGLPFGVQVTESEFPSTDFFGTPNIFRSSTGRLFLCHDVFGASATQLGGGYVYTSDDNGANWDLKIYTDLFWPNIFEQNGTIYILHIRNFDSSYNNGDIYLIWSDDDGENWSSAIELFADDGSFRGYSTHNSNVIERDGFVACALTKRNSTGSGFADYFEVGIIYGDTTDLKDASNWTLSSFVTFNGAALPSTIWSNTAETSLPRSVLSYKGHLEPVLCYDGTNTYLHCRLEQTPNSNYAVYYDVTWNSGTPTSSTISTTPNYHEFAGGHLKQAIVWDSTSSKWWAVVNYNRYKYFNDNRWETYISYSSDFDNWFVCDKVGGWELTSDWQSELAGRAVSYSSIIIDGQDLLIASRVSNFVGDDSHDTNSIAITRVENFRSKTSQFDTTAALILDENSDTISNSSGLSVVLDQSQKGNSAFMLDADNASKTVWNSGFDFNTQNGYMRFMYNEHLMIDTGTGITMYFVVRNLQATSGERLWSFGDTGTDDVRPNNWFFSVNTGMGVATCRGVWTDLTTTNDYIFACSFDLANEYIYNFLNGANRGTPDSTNDATWVTDHLECTASIGSSYLSESRLGNRIVGSSLPFTSFVEAVHIIPSYTTPANVITYMDDLNAIYSIY